jgi:Co/Zn/Cd efflux system component
VLWIALVINALMFIVEIAVGHLTGSLALWADSLDFAGDATNYAVSIFVLGGSLRLRAKASLVKAATIGVFNLWILGKIAINFWHGAPPDSTPIGIVVLLALISNVAVALMLYSHRAGDSNRTSVWLCFRNDAIGNIAVLIAAVVVSLTKSNIPDLLTAFGMSTLGLVAALRIFKQARIELEPKKILTHSNYAIKNYYH